MNARASEHVRDVAAWPSRGRPDRRAVGVDLALGLLAAALALIFAPGLGVVAAGALPLIAVCLVSAVLGRAHARRRRRRPPAPRRRSLSRWP